MDALKKEVHFVNMKTGPYLLSDFELLFRLIVAVAPPSKTMEDVEDSDDATSVPLFCISVSVDSWADCLISDTR